MGGKADIPVTGIVTYMVNQPRGWFSKKRKSAPDPASFRMGWFRSKLMSQEFKHCHFETKNIKTVTITFAKKVDENSWYSKILWCLLSNYIFFIYVKNNNFCQVCFSYFLLRFRAICPQLTNLYFYTPYRKLSRFCPKVSCHSQHAQKGQSEEKNLLLGRSWHNPKLFFFAFFFMNTFYCQPYFQIYSS